MMSHVTDRNPLAADTVTFDDELEEKKRLYYRDVPLEYYEDLVTEDDEPVDSVFHEKQQRLLVDCLNSSWEINRQFVVMSNVGLFYELNEAPIVPDILLSFDVTLPENIMLKQNRSYYVWKYGKPPELVVEVVSNKKGKEADEKIVKYARIGIKVYVVHDPENILNQGLLNVYTLINNRYIPFYGQWLEEIGLGLTLWHGSYEGMISTWLRWCNRDANVLPTGKELSQIQWLRAEQEKLKAEREQQRADQEKLKAEREKKRADQEKLKAEKLAAQLRALGIEPDIS